jgi:hypothetical protein
MYSVLVPLVGGWFAVSSALRHLVEVFPLYLLLGRMNRPWLCMSLAMFQGFLMALWTVGAPVIL